MEGLGAKREAEEAGETGSADAVLRGVEGGALVGEVRLKDIIING